MWIQSKVITVVLTILNTSWTVQEIDVLLLDQTVSKYLNFLPYFEDSVLFTEIMPDHSSYL